MERIDSRRNASERVAAYPLGMPANLGGSDDATMTEMFHLYDNDGSAETRLLGNFTGLSWERKKPPPEWRLTVKTHSSKRTLYEAHPYRPLRPGRAFPAPPFRPLPPAPAQPSFPGPHPSRLQPEESRLVSRFKPAPHQSPRLSSADFSFPFPYTRKRGWARRTAVGGHTGTCAQ